MPRRKKLPAIPDYIGIAPEYQNVQKSNPLQSLSETPLTLPEFKILDAYLSRINSHEPDKRYVRFEKGELEKLLGVTKISKQDLEKRLDNLFVAVTLRDPRKPKGFCKIGLFAKAEAIQDEDGLWKVDLACTYEAMEYIFNIENLGYLKYRLKNIIDLTSRYSYVLYLYLENNRFRKSWEVSINELRKFLNCTAESYNAYKEFNDKILKKCWQELNKKTSLRYTYEPCKKKGRKYTAIKFTIEPLSEDENQLSFDDFILPVPENVEKEKELWQEPLTAFDFTQEQYSEIFSVLVTIPNSKLPQSSACYGSVDLMRYHYIDQKAKEIVRRNSQKPIKNKFAYFLKILKQDADC